ncbi:MAG: ankyrin repeat domain-containing protein [Gemmatimonadota bacterium]|nr:ankyrin repeat domain-containing protein [Gemmatimonadota bacterium]MDH4347953.1 ankyrin repeat domain-containing protein [Gemmatimonadota bacterium]MDH5283962.1 ankyrin repeat domain-containing protein [Gemmatimonadota bacterium]
MTLPALLHRIEAGRTDLILELLDSQGTPDLLSEHGLDLLRWSAYYGDVSACRYLQSRGVELGNLDGNLGLAAAAFHGHWQLCEYMLESGASATAVRSDNGETPLHAALTNEDRVRYDLVVRVLLGAGADPNAKTKPGAPTGAFMRDARTKGETPLHRAAVFGSEATVNLLLAAGATREARDAFGDTPLAWASWARRPVEILRLLLHGEHRIRSQYRPLRANLLGQPTASPDPSLNPRGINPLLQAVHPVLPAKDVGESIRFFEKLRFSLLFLDSEDRPRYAALGRDGVEVHVQWTDEGQWAYPTDRPAFRFAANDVDALFEEFLRSGVIGPQQNEQSPWAAPANTPWGTREFHVRDPAGSSLQFYQPA